MTHITVRSQQQALKFVYQLTVRTMPEKLVRKDGNSLHKGKNHIDNYLPVGPTESKKAKDE